MTGWLARTLYERVATPIAASRIGGRFYADLAPHVDRPLLRLTGGRLSTAGLGRTGLLKVRGAKSGVERQTPLLYIRDGANLLLVASQGGAARHPAWYHNLVATRR